MIVIPARLASTRFKDKILCDIFGLPMFVATAKAMQGVDDVVVAVDDESVLNLAKKHNIRAVMTDKHHQSGTDRIRQACEILGLGADEMVINVQADEPFLEPQNIQKFKDFCQKRADDAFMFSCFKLADVALADDANLVKVVTDKDGFALYFSRSKIPFDRAPLQQYKAHIGIYGYSVASLNEFCGFGYSVLENTEKLEQLRALENGKKIAMLQIESDSIGIDTPEDLQRALSRFGG